MELQTEHTTTILGTCPICGHGKLHSCTKGWQCDNKECTYTLFSLYCNAVITEKDARKLINGWVTGFKDFENKKNRKYRAKLKLEIDGKLTLIPSQSQGTDLRCPDCQGKIRETDKCFICENSASESCQFLVWRNWHKHRFTVEDIAALIRNGKTATYSDFRDKLGKPYAAYVLINEVGKPVLKNISD